MSRYMHRHIHQDDDERNDKAETCACCGGEFDPQNTEMETYYHNRQGALIEDITLCDDCNQDALITLREAINWHDEELSPEDFAKLAAFCKVQRVMEFVTEPENLRTVKDVEEFITAMQRGRDVCEREIFVARVAMASCTDRAFKGELCECGLCGWEGPTKALRCQLGDIPDLCKRIEPGGEVPVGECPECGGLSYIMKDGKTKNAG